MGNHDWQQHHTIKQCSRCGRLPRFGEPPKLCECTNLIVNPSHVVEVDYSLKQVA